MDVLGPIAASVLFFLGLILYLNWSVERKYQHWAKKHSAEMEARRAMHNPPTSNSNPTA